MLLWCVCVPCVSSCLSWLAGCHQGMPLQKNSNGSKVHMLAPRGCKASSEDCPNPAECDQFGSHWRQWQGWQTQWWTKGKRLWEHPQEGFVCASRGLALHVSCTTDLNVVNWHGWEDSFLQPGQKSASLSRRMLQVGKQDISGKQKSYLRTCPYSSPLLTKCTANCTSGYLTTPTWVQEDG